MVDLKNLDKYILVPMGKVAVGDVEDLRELEGGEFGHGVYALFSDELETIVAFAFEPTVWDEAKANEWVSEVKQKNFSAMDVISTFVRGLLGMKRAPLKIPEKKTLRSFDDTRQLVNVALDVQYGVSNDTDTAMLSDGPWIVDIGPSSVVFEMGSVRYVCSYSVDIEGVVTLGDPAKVDKEWMREDGSPVLLHRFDVTLGAGDEAEDGEDDGLIWKELIHPGQWHKTDTGRLVEVTADMIQEVFRAYEAGLPKFVSVPTNGHPIGTEGVNAEDNRGFVAKLKLIGDRLFGAFDITDPLVAMGVGVGSIADCSVGFIANRIHPQTGEKFSWVLDHVLLTNDPLAQDLAPFGVLASAGDDAKVVVVSYQSENQEVKAMSDQVVGQGLQPPEAPSVTPPASPPVIQLSATERENLEAMNTLGLSAADIQEMVAARNGVREKARDLEITQIVRALEGKDEHASVLQIEGYRHLPVVCAAVEKALKEQPETLSLSANDQGVSGLDALVLEIVNAIPEEGRIACAGSDDVPAGNRLPEDGDKTLLSGEDEDATVTEEQVEDLSKRLGL